MKFNWFLSCSKLRFVRIRSQSVRGVYFAEELASKTDPYRLEIMDPEQVSKLGLVLHLFQTRPRCEDCMIVSVAIKPHGHPISIYCSIATCSENKKSKVRSETSPAAAKVDHPQWPGRARGRYCIIIKVRLWAWGRALGRQLHQAWTWKHFVRRGSRPQLSQMIGDPGSEEGEA